MRKKRRTENDYSPTPDTPSAIGIYDPALSRRRRARGKRWRADGRRDSRLRGNDRKEKALFCRSGEPRRTGIFDHGTPRVTGGGSRRINVAMSAGFLSFVDGCVGDVVRADVFGLGSDEAVGVELFDGVTAPACDAAQGEHGREQIEL